MTENEAIEIIQCFPKWNEDNHWLSSGCMKEFVECCVESLEEIQQYRAIGTVEECRKAVEKQKPKKFVKDKYHHNCCPNCGWIVSGEGGYGEEFCPHCENCGQAIQWDENFGGNGR